MLADIFKQLMAKDDGDGDEAVSPKTTAKMAAQGRDGDSLIAHINPREAMILKAIGGRGSVNPKTGALEFAFDSDGAMGGSGGWSYGDPGSYTAQDLGNLNSSLDAAGFGPSSNFGDNGGGNTGFGNFGSSMLSGQGYDLSPQANALSTFDPNAAGAVADAFNARFAPGGDLQGLLGNGGDTSGFTAAPGFTSAPTGDYYGTPGDQLAAEAVTSMAAPAGAASPSGAAAGGINPDASMGFNPLSSWQASFGTDAGAENALARTDQGEYVYGNNQPSLGNLRGFRDNSNYQVDGFQRATMDDLVRGGVGAGGLGGQDGTTTVDPERPDAAGMPAGTSRGSGVPATWGGVGPEGFGIGGGRYSAGATPGAPGTYKGSADYDAFGRTVPQMDPNYRDQSSFSTPMADAMARAYAQNPNLPDGYLEGMYGIESSYGTNMHRPGSSYEGPFQFDKPSMETAAPQLAPVTRSTMYDPYANMQALLGEYDKMTKALGRNPSAPEAYAIHQQGMTAGPRSILNPGTPMTDLGTPRNRVTANGLPADASYNDFIQKFGTPFQTQSNYDPNVTVQAGWGPTSMFR